MPTIGDGCTFDRTLTVEVVDWCAQTLKGQPIDDAGVDMLLSMEMENIWRGYAQGGFDAPDGATWRAQVFFRRGSKVVQMISVTQSSLFPDWYYVLPFTNLKPFADAQGQHFGVHPCAGLRVRRTQFDKWLAALRATWRG